MPGTRLRLVRRPATASTIGMPPASSWLMSHAPENGVEPTLVEFCDMHHPKIKVRKKKFKKKKLKKGEKLGSRDAGPARIRARRNQKHAC